MGEVLYFISLMVYVDIVIFLLNKIFLIEYRYMNILTPASPDRNAVGF